ncbi:MAG: hypothetical protein IT170_13525 [Bryobacterales bacterium]|nr:hypothetical protein [Bryobacterales bacterium]
MNVRILSSSKRPGSGVNRDSATGATAAGAILPVIRHCLVSFAILVCALPAQTQYAKPEAALASPAGIAVGSPGLARAAQAMGERLKDPAKARIVMRGILLQDGRPTPAVILWQTPGRVAISLGGITPGALQFNPSRPDDVQRRTPAEDRIFESLYADLPETFLADMANGAAYRYLGGRFRLDDGSDPEYGGPFLEVYQVLPRTGSRLRAANNEYARYYRFSSETMLAHSVIYMRGPESNATRVETRFLGWSSRAGEMMPSEIIRLENGKETLRFTTEAAEFLPSVP